LISTKEKSFKKLTATFGDYFFIKKAPTLVCVTQAWGPTRKETYTPPLDSTTMCRSFLLSGSALQKNGANLFDIQVATAHIIFGLALPALSALLLLKSNIKIIKSQIKFKTFYC